MSQDPLRQAAEEALEILWPMIRDGDAKKGGALWVICTDHLLAFAKAQRREEVRAVAQAVSDGSVIPPNDPWNIAPTMQALSWVRRWCEQRIKELEGA